MSVSVSLEAEPIMKIIIIIFFKSHITDPKSIKNHKYIKLPHDFDQSEAHRNKTHQSNYNTSENMDSSSILITFASCCLFFQTREKKLNN